MKTANCTRSAMMDEVGNMVVLHAADLLLTPTLRGGAYSPSTKPRRTRETTRTTLNIANCTRSMMIDEIGNPHDIFIQPLSCGWLVNFHTKRRRKLHATTPDEQGKRTRRTLNITYCTRSTIVDEMGNPHDTSSSLSSATCQIYRPYRDKKRHPPPTTPQKQGKRTRTTLNITYCTRSAMMD